MSWKANCQPTAIKASAKPAAKAVAALVCISAKQAALIKDSLRVLNMARNESGAWQAASDYYRRAADSANVATAKWRGAYLKSAQSYDGQTLLYSNQIAETGKWKGRARRRGLLNWLFIAAAGGLTYLTVKP